MKKIVLLTLCVALFACTNEPVPEKGYVPTQSVDLDRDKLEMVVGDVVELRATVNPKNATNQNVEWESSDQTVVSVRNGEVKAIGPGRAIVTVYTEEGGYTSECVVDVSPKVQTQKKGPMTLSLRYVTATTAELSGFLDVDQLAGYDVSGGGVGFIYAPSGTKLDIDNAKKVSISSVDSENAFSKTLTGLKYDTRYNYTIFLYKNGILQYGETQYFDTEDVTISVDQVSVTNTKAILKGAVVRRSEDSDVKVGLMYSTSNTFPSGSKSYTITPSIDGSYTQEITGLAVGQKYYYRTYLYYGGRYEYGETKEFMTNTINVTLSVSSKTATTVTFAGKMNPVTDKSNVAIGVYVNTSETVNSSNNKRGVVVNDSDIADDGTFSITVTGLTMATKYFFTPFVYSNSTYTYGEIKDFTTENIVAALSASDVTATTAQITGTITGLSDVDKSEIDAIGIAYSTSSSSLKSSNSSKKSVTYTSANAFTVSLKSLTNNTKYYYCSYVKQDGVFTYGETKEFNTVNVTPSVSVVAFSITATKVTISGSVPNLSDSDISSLEFGVAYSTSSSSLKTSSSAKILATLSSAGTFSVSLEGLDVETKYYYCSYVKQNGRYTYGETKEFTTPNPYNTSADLNVASATDLSSSGFANCYIISESGFYKYKAVKGNSNESVGSVASASILWETLGTNTAPEPLDLIGGVCYKDDYIAFQTADAFKEGNAVIAAKDADGNILWSWHIWFTDQPQGQVYYNNAGTMMDRNLGATSAPPGDVGALGLLYQWGRKDPFLGSSSINTSTLAKSTITWPSTVSSNSSNGTIAYATAHPTTFITYNSSNYDWYYTGSSSTDNTRWTTSEKDKSIYDPCPAGWRVPDGGYNGVWSKALGSSSKFENLSFSNAGMYFSGKFGSASTIEYPASGCRSGYDDSLYDAGNRGYYWSASPASNHACSLAYNGLGIVYPSGYNDRANGFAVRCLQESK